METDNKFTDPEQSAVSGAQQDYDSKEQNRAAPAAGAAGQKTDPFILLPPDIPTQEGPLGIRYDFNDGARILLPEGKWYAQIIDDESDNILFACDSDGGWVVSTKKYYVPFRIKVWRRGEQTPLLDHTMNLKDRAVLIKFPVGTLGDLMGWFPYAEKFLHKHDCILECAMGQEIIDLVKDNYPDMTLSVPQKVRMTAPYASYRVGLFFGGNLDDQPIDFRIVGLHRTAGYILGVDPEEIRPRLSLGSERIIKEPYVCIATKSTCQAKYWNNGHGWPVVINYLKQLGYRVLCIDRDQTVGSTYVWNQLPYGVEDHTGSKPLKERVALLEHADFFIGLSSGLAWLAWATKIPIVLISGFTLPICEFNTPYRVYNTHGCTGCWDDMTLRFDHHDFFWCPRHKGTDRMYECTRLITGKQVKGHIDRLMQDNKLKPPGKRPKIDTHPFTGGPAKARVTSSDEFGYNAMSISSESNFSTLITDLVEKYQPSFIIETGTFQGAGTTAALAKGVAALKNKCAFYTIEVNTANWHNARENLRQSGLLPYVQTLNGLSVPRELLPGLASLKEQLADGNIPEGTFVDFPEDIRAQTYYSETDNLLVPDDMLGKCLEECGCSPDMVLLDSAGHMGYIEFQYLIGKLRSKCLLILDDTNHVKHRESVAFIKSDPRFTIMEQSDEKFGYCVAEYIPAKESAT